MFRSFVCIPSHTRVYVPRKRSRFLKPAGRLLLLSAGLLLYYFMTNPALLSGLVDTIQEAWHVFLPRLDQVLYSICSTAVEWIEDLLGSHV